MKTEGDSKAATEEFVPVDVHEALKKDFQNFAYIVSHDINAPLRHIREFTKILLSDLEPHIEGDTKEIADVILRNVDTAQEMVQCLVQYSRLNTQIQPFQRIDTTVLVKDLLNTFQPRIQSAGGDVKVGELPDLFGDVQQISQMFQCLLDNAIKFRRPDAPLKIEISGLSGEEDNLVTVEDNGLGLPDNRLEKVFELFNRQHISGNDGLGVGLTLCKKIVGLHGGSIRLESNPDEGSKLIISIPNRNHTSGGNY